MKITESFFIIVPSQTYTLLVTRLLQELGHTLASNVIYTDTQTSKGGKILVPASMADLSLNSTEQSKFTSYTFQAFFSKYFSVKSEGETDSVWVLTAVFKAIRGVSSETYKFKTKAQAIVARDAFQSISNTLFDITLVITECSQ